MDEGNGIIWRSFGGVAVIAPEVHALVQEGDEVPVIRVGRGRVKSDIMENPEIREVGKGGKAGKRFGHIAAIQQVNGGIGEEVSGAGHVRHVEPRGVYALNEGAVGFGGLDKSEFFQGFAHEVGEVGSEFVSQGRSAGQYGQRRKPGEKMAVIQEGRQTTYVVVMKVGDEDGLRFFYQIFFYEAGIYGKAAVYEESLALPGEDRR